MGRKPAPQPLSLSDSVALGEEGPRSGETLQFYSPTESRSIASPRSPRSPFRFAPSKSPQAGGKQTSLQLSDDDLQLPQDTQQQRQAQIQGPESPQYSPIDSALHQTLDTSTRQRRTDGPQTTQRLDASKPSKSGFFFNFNKASKSSHSLSSPPPPHQNPTDSRSEGTSRGSENPPMPSKSTTHTDMTYADHSVQKPAPSIPSKSDLSLASTGDYETSTAQTLSKKAKPKPFGLLTRTKSVRDKDGPSPKEHQPIPAPVKIHEPERAYAAGNNAGLKTAPLGPDRSFRDMMSSAVRNRSEDRSAARDISAHREAHRDREHPRTQPSSLRENGGSNFFSGLKSGGTRAADMISKGLFGKGVRSGSTTEREPVIDDEHYVLKVINLPLVEQTRLTRISKRLEDSRDKTEFWMPAFPWRAIDYLNYKGCDVEGLYRVPGSGPQIKKWQRKFDEEYDVNLFDQDDLYDINIIGSMLKAWLRELPDELFPKVAQERVARECAGADTVPQMLIDELSNLSPFNYYLLFAITCHLSLLLAHSDKNKMDFRNLCICFQPCMKIDAFCFKFLVCDWRDCWKGCKAETRFIEQEYMLFDQPPPRGLAEPRKPVQEEQPPPLPLPLPHDDRAVSSSDSSKQSNQSNDQQKGRLKKKALQVSESSGSVASASTLLTINSERDIPPRRSGDLRPLSPIKPLSPLGF